MEKRSSLKQSGLKVTLPRLKILEIFEQNSEKHLQNDAENICKQTPCEKNDFGMIFGDFGMIRDDLDVPRRPQTSRNVPKRPKSSRNGPKRPETTRNGPKPEKSIYGFTSEK